MQLSLSEGAGGGDVWLDELCTERILMCLDATDLSSVCRVCKALNSPAQEAAHQSLLLLFARLSVTVLRERARNTWIVRLHQWERVELSLRVWHHAGHVELKWDSDGRTLVEALNDLSGNGHDAVRVSSAPPPTLSQQALNGLPALSFDGAHLLKAGPFAKPLQQPITLMTVACARGDVTMIDSFGARSERFELCHGYPSGWHPAPQIFMTASGRDQVAKSKKNKRELRAVRVDRENREKHKKEKSVHRIVPSRARHESKGQPCAS